MDWTKGKLWSFYLLKDLVELIQNPFYGMSDRSDMPANFCVCT